MTFNPSQDIPKISEAEALEKRYVDAYAMADANEQIGSRYRMIALLLGILTVFIALLALTSTYSLLATVSVSFPGMLLTAYVHSAGIHMSTQAQLLRTTIDGAINTSPFLQHEQKAAIMDLNREPLIATAQKVDKVADDAEINLRFFMADERSLTLSQLETNLQQVNPAYKINDVSTRSAEAGIFNIGPDVLGQLEIKRYGRKNFDHEIKEFTEVMQTTKRANKQVVTDVLENTKVIVVLTLPPGSRENGDIQEKVEPLWEWLFANRTGLLHIDEEGFYRGMELIFELD